MARLSSLRRSRNGPFQADLANSTAYAMASEPLVGSEMFFARGLPLRERYKLLLFLRGAFIFFRQLFR